MALWYVDFSAGTNGSGTTAGSPLNSASAIVTAAPASGDTVYCTGTLNGVLALSTLAGTSLAFSINFVGVTSLSTLDMSSRTTVNASGNSAALTGSGNYLLFDNFLFQNSTSTTNQHSGANITFVNCDFKKGTGSASAAFNTFDQYVDYCRFYNYTGTAVTVAGVSGSRVMHCYFEGCGAGVVSTGYRSLNLEGNVFVTITNDAISVPDNGNIGSAASIKNNTFYSVGGNGIVIGGNGNSEVHANYNLFGSVTGTCIKITAASPTGTTVGAHRNYFYSVGTNLGTNVKDNGLNITLGTNPFTSAPTDVTPTSASGLRNLWPNNANLGGMQNPDSGGGGGYIGHALLGGEL